MFDEELFVGLGVGEGGGELVLCLLGGFACWDVFFERSVGDVRAELREGLLDCGGERGEGRLDGGGSG